MDELLEFYGVKTLESMSSDVLESSFSCFEIIVAFLVGMQAPEIFFAVSTNEAYQSCLTAQPFLLMPHIPERAGEPAEVFRITLSIAFLIVRDHAWVTQCLPG